MAAGDLPCIIHRTLCRFGNAAILAERTRADMDCHAGGYLCADVGWRVGPDAGHRGLLGRPAIDLDPRDIRPGLCLSACRAGRTWAPFDQAARSEVPLRVICGADPRRS